MDRRSRAGALALGIALAGTAWPQAAGPGWTNTAELGGPGGTPIVLSCRDGFLAGVGLKQGDVLDRVWPLCVGRAPAGGWSGPPVPQPALAMGGDGGRGPNTLACPQDAFVTSLTVHLRRDYLTGVVQRLRINCTHPASGRIVAVAVPESLPYTTAGEGVACPAGMFANGLGGGSGTVVDRVGLLCVRPPDARRDAVRRAFRGRPG